MIGNVTGNDTGNVSRTCKHIISEKIKLVNTNLVEVLFDAYRVRLYAYFEQKRHADPKEYCHRRQHRKFYLFKERR